MKFLNVVCVDNSCYSRNEDLLPDRLMFQKKLLEKAINNISLFCTSHFAVLSLANRNGPQVVMNINEDKEKAIRALNSITAQECEANVEVGIALAMMMANTNKTVQFNFVRIIMMVASPFVASDTASELNTKISQSPLFHFSIGLVGEPENFKLLHRTLFRSVDPQRIEIKTLSRNDKSLNFILSLRNQSHDPFHLFSSTEGVAHAVKYKRNIHASPSSGLATGSRSIPKISFSGNCRNNEIIPSRTQTTSHGSWIVQLRYLRSPKDKVHVMPSNCNFPREPLLEFKAGRMVLRDGMMHAEPEKGLVLVTIGEGPHLRWKWVERSTGQVSMDVLITPGTAKFSLVHKAPPGSRVYKLQIQERHGSSHHHSSSSSSSSRHQATGPWYFWMQEPVHLTLQQTRAQDVLCRSSSGSTSSTSPHRRYSWSPGRMSSSPENPPLPSDSSDVLQTPSDSPVSSSSAVPDPSSSSSSSSSTSAFSPSPEVPSSSSSSSSSSATRRVRPSRFGVELLQDYMLRQRINNLINNADSLAPFGVRRVKLQKVLQYLSRNGNLDANNPAVRLLGRLNDLWSSRQSTSSSSSSSSSFSSSSSSSSSSSISIPKTRPNPSLCASPARRKDVGTSKAVAVIRTPNSSVKSPRALNVDVSSLTQVDEKSMSNHKALEAQLRLRQQATNSSSPTSTSTSTSTSSSASSSSSFESGSREMKRAEGMTKKKRVMITENEDEDIPASNHNSTPLYLRRRHATVCVTSDLRSQPSLLSPSSSAVKIPLPDTRPSSSGLLVVKPSSSPQPSSSQKMDDEPFGEDEEEDDDEDDENGNNSVDSSHPNPQQQQQQQQQSPNKKTQP